MGRLIQIASFIAFLAVNAEASSPNLQGLRNALPRDPQSYTSILSLLQDLPQNVRASFSLVRRSGGVQHASDAFPRVIMGSCLNPDCTMPFPIIAFHGKPDGLNYNSLEIADYDPSSKFVDFFRIRERNGGLEFSEKNPTMCQGCHHEDTGVIWSPYPFWPGFYRPQIHVAMTPEERGLLETFWATRSSNARYSILEDKSAVYLSQNASVNPNYEVELPQILGISRAMHTIVQGVMARKIKFAPRTDSVKYAIAAALSQCEPESYLPAEMIQNFPKNLANYRELYVAIRARRSEPHREPVNYSYYPLAQLLYTLDILGLPTEQLFNERRGLAFEERQFLFGVPDFSADLVLRDGILDADLEPYTFVIRTHGVDTRGYYCDGVGPLSIDKLRAEVVKP